MGWRRKPKTENQHGLLGCPFCGRVPEVHRYAMHPTGEIRYGIWCSNGRQDQCPMEAVETLPFETREEAIAAWNTRRSA